MRELGRLTAPLLVIYGYQDFEPITQAFTLREHLPQTRIVLRDECAHVPWLEQPDGFYRELVAFLEAPPLAPGAPGTE